MLSNIRFMMLIIVFSSSFSVKSSELPSPEKQSKNSYFSRFALPTAVLCGAAGFFYTQKSYFFPIINPIGNLFGRLFSNFAPVREPLNHFKWPIACSALAMIGLVAKDKRKPVEEPVKENTKITIPNAPMPDWIAIPSSSVHPYPKSSNESSTIQPLARLSAVVFQEKEKQAEKSKPLDSGTIHSEVYPENEPWSPTTYQKRYDEWEKKLAAEEETRKKLAGEILSQFYSNPRTPSNTKTSKTPINPSQSGYKVSGQPTSSAATPKSPAKSYAAAAKSQTTYNPLLSAQASPALSSPNSPLMTPGTRGNNVGTSYNAAHLAIFAASKEVPQ